MRLMKAVARRVALNLAETKRFAVINQPIPLPSGPGASQYWFMSPLSALVNGTSSFNIVGSEIANVLMKLKFKITIPWSYLWANANPVGSNYGTVSLMVALIATNEDALTNSSWTNFNPVATPYFWMYQSDVDKPMFNGHNVKVLKMWKRTVTPDQISAAPPAGTNEQVIKGKMTYRWRKKIRFEEQGTVPGVGGMTRGAYTKGWQYQLVYAYGMRGTANSVTNQDYPRLVSDTYLYFKDP